LKVFSFIEIVRINGYYCFYESGGEKIAYPVFEGQKGLSKVPPTVFSPALTVLISATGEANASGQIRDSFARYYERYTDYL
jgi:hypothetical protein